MHFRRVLIIFYFLKDAPFTFWYYVSDYSEVADDGEVDGEVDGEREVALGAEPEAEFVVGLVVVVAPGAEDDGAVTDSDDDLPLDRTANHSFSTPWPRACPFFASLTNV